MGNLSREYIVYMPFRLYCSASSEKNVAASLQTPSEETSVFCDWLMTNLNKIMDGSVNSSGSLNREKLWTEYYQLQISPAFTEKWGGFLQSVSAPTEAIYF